jgi:hypothetical protein
MKDGIRAAGVDPGFGKNAAAEVVSIEREEEGSNGQHTKVRERRLVTSFIPSVVGVGSTETGALDLAGVVQPGRRRTMPTVVAFDGIEYLVGHGVARFATPIERMDFRRFTDSPELRALLYASLYPLLNGGSHKLALAIGLPVEALADREQAAAIERDMAGWLLGEHHFAIDGTPALVEIVKAKVKPQPLATWLDWGLNNEGLWQREKELVRAPFLIIDLGFNTLDLYGIENGEVSGRYTGGEMLGMRRAAEMVINNLRPSKVEMSLHEADELVQRGVNGKKVWVYVNGSPLEVTAMVRQAVNSLGSEVGRFIDSKVKGGGKFRILITGGGGLALGARLLNQYPKATIVDDPVLANARGLAKLAARPGFWD